MRRVFALFLFALTAFAPMTLSGMSAASDNGDERIQSEVSDAAEWDETEATEFSETDPTPVPADGLVPEPTDGGTPCLNSYEPRCGDFYWDPKPDPGDPMSVEVTFSPAEPHVGDEVEFTLTVEDNALWEPFPYRQEFGDYPARQWCVMCDGRERFGPWRPPPKVARVWTKTVSHVYLKADKYTATFALAQFCDGYDPYAGSGVGTVSISVAPRTSDEDQSNGSATVTTSPGPSEAPTPGDSSDVSPTPEPTEATTTSQEPEATESPPPDASVEAPPDEP